MQQLCDIFGNKGMPPGMILGDNPTGHGFVLRDLVLRFQDMQPLQLGGGGGVKNFRNLCRGGGGPKFYFWWCGGGWGGGRGHVILK